MFAALISCVSSSRPTEHRVSSQLAGRDVVGYDKSFDWHGLIILPFGTLLKDSRLSLHEVLLFHDDSHEDAEPDNQDCYGIETPPPLLVGHVPDRYLLCFVHDRLRRIEATVLLSGGQAFDVFARACGEWRQSGAPTSKVDSPAGTCMVRAGNIELSARLDVSIDPLSPRLAITLSSNVDP